jgi:hypothetical protein
MNYTEFLELKNTVKNAMENVSDRIDKVEEICNLANSSFKIIQREKGKRIKRVKKRCEL